MQNQITKEETTTINWPSPSLDNYYENKKVRKLMPS